MDKELYKARMFALKMIKEGLPFNTAVGRSAKYYGFSFIEVRDAVARRKSVKKWFAYCIVGTDPSMEIHNQDSGVYYGYASDLRARFGQRQASLSWRWDTYDEEIVLLKGFKTEKEAHECLKAEGYE